MKLMNPRLWTLAALALVPLLANWPVIIGWLTVDPIYTASGLGTNLVPGPLPGITALDMNVGVTTQALGHLAAIDWLSGRIPWWNPYDGIGLPLSAEGQNQALFLPFILLLALHNGPFLLLILMQEIAAFATYGLLSQMGLARAASWIGAAIYCTNGTFTWFGHGPIMPIAFAPLTLLGIEMEWQAIQRTPRNRSCCGWMIVAIAIAFSLYAGFIETAYLDGLLAAAWSAVRIAQCGGAQRIVFTCRVGLAAVTGVLLATPYIIPFACLLSAADIGLHADISAFAAPPATLPLLIMPHALGPEPFGANDPSEVLLWLWDFVGGYVSLPVVLLAIIALMAYRTPNRALRWMLGAWIAAMIAATFGVPAIARVVYAIPGLAQVQVFRYSPPSWELAASVLASHAIDDWRGGGGRSRRCRLGLALLLLAVLTGAMLAAASRSIAYLRANIAHYDPWLFISLAEAGAVTLLTAALLATKPAARRILFLAMLLTCDSSALFSVPRLAGPREAKLDTAAIDFLKANLGLQRMYSLGALQPNYSAFLELASINSDYLPTPLSWARHVKSVLDPLSDANAFTGNYQFPRMPYRDHRITFQANLPSYRDLAVRYVIVPAGESLEPPPLPSGPAKNDVPMILANEDAIEFGHIFDAIDAGSIESVMVSIGTFSGKSDGELSVTACAGERCQTGTGRLFDAVDDAPIEIRLDAPLLAEAGSPLTLRFTHTGGTSPVAIWTSDRAADVSLRMTSGATVGPIAMPFGVPRNATSGQFRRVYADRVMTIFELIDSVPYFETVGGTCTVTATDRETVTTTCATPARLIRRELFFDGWSATLDGRSAPILQYHDILQSVEIPAGVARIAFHYAPPYTSGSATALVLGLLVLAGGLLGRSRWL